MEVDAIPSHYFTLIIDPHLSLELAVLSGCVRFLSSHTGWFLLSIFMFCYTFNCLLYFGWLQARPDCFFVVMDLDWISSICPLHYTLSLMYKQCIYIGTMYCMNGLRSNKVGSDDPLHLSFCPIRTHGNVVLASDRSNRDRRNHIPTLTCSTI